VAAHFTLANELKAVIGYLPQIDNEFLTEFEHYIRNNPLKAETLIAYLQKSGEKNYVSFQHIDLK
jgi:hypothetical protein